MPSILDTVNALISLEDFKAYLSNDVNDEIRNDTTNDNDFERIINAVSHFFNGRTGRKLLYRENTEYYDGDGTQVLRLDNWPVVSTAAEIAIYSDPDRAYGADTKIAAAGIIIYPARGKILLDGAAFATGAQATKVVYTAGYVISGTVTIPWDLAMAVRQMASVLWKQQKDKLSGLATVSIGGASVTLIEEMMPKFVEDVLWRESHLCGPRSA